MKISLSAWRCATPLILLLLLVGCLAHPESPARPGTITFSALSPAGDELVTAFVDASETRLLRTSASSGANLGVITFPGRCEALLARPGEWLIFVTTLETYRFGGNLRSRLLRWDGTQPPREFPLNDTTLDRSTLVLKDQLVRTLQPQLSPYGDEVLLARLHDPPAFPPYLEIVLYHLDSQKNHTIAKIPGLRAIAEYREGGDRVAWSDGRSPLKLVDPWNQEELVSLQGVVATPLERTEKVLLLRKWRAMGLITAHEYAAIVREGQE